MSDTHDDNEGPISAMYQTVVDVAVTEAVEAERDQCCKEACELCAIGIPVEQRDGTWKHQAMKWSGKLHWFHCGASAIRERAAKEKDNES